MIKYTITLIITEVGHLTVQLGVLTVFSIIVNFVQILNNVVQTQKVNSH